MIRHHFEFRDTFATVIAERESDIDLACRAMIAARSDIERYISIDPFFRTSFEPLPVDSDIRIVHHMAESSARASVGPMASVAGAIAYYGILAMQQAGASYGIIDNGGDIALISDRPIRIGLFAGESLLSGKYAFILEPKPGGYGVCTSSATVGPSISLGTADGVTVFSSDPVLADAVATQVCNVLKPDDQEIFKRIDPGIDGIFAVFGEISLIWGNVPKIVPAQVDEKLITSGGL